MSTILVRIPSDTTVGSLKALADDIACDVRLLPDGTYWFRPRHGNATVVPMQHHRHQLARLNARDLPQPPNGDAA